MAWGLVLTCCGSRPPSVEEKIYFSQNIYKISSADLKAVVDLLSEKCPKALDKVRKLSHPIAIRATLTVSFQGSPDELDIVIDSIDNKTFRELEKFVLERVPEGSREPVITPKSSSSKKSRRSSKDSSSFKKTKTAE